MADYNPNDYRQPHSGTASQNNSTLSEKMHSLTMASFMSRVYGLMGAGLAVTAIVAYFVASSPSLIRMFVLNPVMMIVMCLAELGLVVLLSWGINKLSASAAMAGFIAFALLNGITLSSLLLVYTGASVASTFFVCAGCFGALSLFGAVTQRDLTGVGSFCFIGLIGLVLASVVNIFMQNSMVNIVLGYIGVLIFAGLTAYDTQRLKEMGATAMDSESSRKYGVLGALTLYLDFINLFISLLRIMGDRR